MDTQHPHPGHPFRYVGRRCHYDVSFAALFSLDIEHALRVIIIDALTILALLEIFKTTMAYFSEGRIKVTYIIDTVIVVMLTEIMACWFKEFDLYKLGTIAVLVLVLCVMRVFSVKYSPGINTPDP